MSNPGVGSGGASSSGTHTISPDRDAFAATANSQIDSPFFARLPPEIRELIYIEFWRNDGVGSLRQHILWRDGRPTRVPCVTDPLAKDIRFTKFNNADPGSYERSAWHHRLTTSWSLHWACEEAHLARVDIPKSSFLPVLLSCKRMQSVSSIYDNVIIVFTHLLHADEFLSRCLPPAPPPVMASRSGYETGSQVAVAPPFSFRSIELCIRITHLLTEMYFPFLEVGINTTDGPSPVHTINNPWARVCNHLARHPTLDSLRIWFDSRDLRPWHRRVSETRMFAGLFNVRTKSKGSFILELPALPDAERDRSSDFDMRMGRHHYLEGDRLADAPFIVIRGPRPNNWRIHMVRAFHIYLGDALFP
ncbi:hypothetical protein B0T16DRAFT_333823 [Cercophora newfieldiana]|uniref:DUF7730 domain-containing protein n=1 Tax=Cercophora newfieldiana TaxID=92897 RepID=A0AA39Y021_9PEZI|nr:hypothetical protein B0T16DRAFT_333823 [Cercophora newfieldiana]